MSWTEMAVDGRILVVDDAMENVQILNAALEGEHEVLFALDGARALEMARTQRPALVLLDAVMPGMDGYAVCAALRSAADTRDIPVIFVTALKSPEDETRALAAGAADFITKPIRRVRVPAAPARRARRGRPGAQIARVDGAAGGAARALPDRGHADTEHGHRQPGAARWAVAGNAGSRRGRAAVPGQDRWAQLL